MLRDSYPFLHKLDLMRVRGSDLHLQIISYGELSQSIHLYMISLCVHSRKNSFLNTYSSFNLRSGIFSVINELAIRITAKFSSGIGNMKDVQIVSGFLCKNFPAWSSIHRSMNLSGDRELVSPAPSYIFNSSLSFSQSILGLVLRLSGIGSSWRQLFVWGARGGWDSMTWHGDWEVTSMGVRAKWSIKISILKRVPGIHLRLAGLHYAIINREWSLELLTLRFVCYRSLS